MILKNVAGMKKFGREGQTALRAHNEAMMAFGYACKMNQPKIAEDARAAAHASLDAYMDATSAMWHNTREMARLSNQKEG